MSNHHSQEDFHGYEADDESHEMTIDERKGKEEEEPRDKAKQKEQDQAMKKT